MPKRISSDTQSQSNGVIYATSARGRFIEGILIGWIAMELDALVVSFWTNLGVVRALTT